MQRRFRGLMLVPLFFSLGWILATPDASAAISSRKREPVVVKMTAAKISRWVDQGYATSTFEAWIYKDNQWSITPFQIDEIGDHPEDLKPFILQSSSRLLCNGSGGPPPQDWDGPCEFLYDLRGTNEPGGTLSTNDELVFIAGLTGACTAAANSWPAVSSLFDSFRQKIVIKDAAETGCVYLLRRTGGTRPTVPDLVHYDPTGDGEPSSCVPHADACGAITADAADVDGDGTNDLAAYRFDFRGDWAIDKFRIGGTTVDTAKDVVDIVKSRCFNPAETERAWDQQEPTGPNGQTNAGCAYFAGYIDGPVRVVRVIQGAMSGATERKFEFAYPGEITARVNHRVHRIGGPVTSYFDLLQSNVSGGSNAKIYKEGYTNGNGYDTVDGQRDPHLPDPASEEWFQLSSSLGSFLQYRGDEQYYRIGSRAGVYSDTTTQRWQVSFPAEYDAETGERGAFRTEWSQILDSQNPLCVDPRGDGITPIGEITTVILSSSSAAADVGLTEMNRRRAGPLSQCIVEEGGSGGGGGPCVPILNASYGHNSGAITLSASNCSNTLGWNLYQVLGGGVLRRLASLGAGESFKDVNLDLNEQRSYRASTFTGDCAEGTLTSSLTVTHDDTAGPTAPTSVQGSAGSSAITVSWVPPLDGDVDGFKVLVGEQSGGPYTQAHSGILTRMIDSLTFQAVGGPKTYYLVVKAVDKAGNTGTASAEISVTVQ